MLLNKDISGLSSLKKKSIANIKVIVDKTGKESISVETVIQGKTYTSQYVIE